jgi:hypothetical protein
MSFLPCLIRSSTAAGDARFELGDPLVDRYLEFVAGRSRPNTLRAVAFDLKTFFVVVAKDPVDVEAADVFEFLAHQRGDRTVIRMSDRESGLSARTIARRLSSVLGVLCVSGRAGRYADRHCCVGRKQDNSSAQGRDSQVCESVGAAYLGRSESPISDSASDQRAPRRLNATVPPARDDDGLGKAAGQRSRRVLGTHRVDAGCGR